MRYATRAPLCASRRAKTSAVWDWTTAKPVFTGTYRRPSAGLSGFSGSSQLPERSTFIARAVFSPWETAVSSAQLLENSRLPRTPTDTLAFAMDLATPKPSGAAIIHMSTSTSLDSAKLNAASTLRSLADDREWTTSSAWVNSTDATPSYVARSGSTVLGVRFFPPGSPEAGRRFTLPAPASGARALKIIPRGGDRDGHRRRYLIYTVPGEPGRRLP